MARHLHVICRTAATGIGSANLKPVLGADERPVPGQFRSGVWLLSMEDAANTFDFIWLHEGVGDCAYNGGKVIKSLERANAADCTQGDAPLSLDRRWTITFERSVSAPFPRDIKWQGTLKANSYAIHED